MTALESFETDPFGRVADFGRLPGADLVLITHEHRDHLDPDALAQIRTPATEVVLTELGARGVPGGVVMRNGDARTVAGVHMRTPGVALHPRGYGNGYLLSFGHTRLYIAGDTENIPDMKALADIDVAFLPMNLPYTMSREMVAGAARVPAARALSVPRRRHGRQAPSAARRRRDGYSPGVRRSLASFSSIYRLRPRPPPQMPGRLRTPFHVDRRRSSCACRSVNHRPAVARPKRRKPASITACGRAGELGTAHHKRRDRLAIVEDDQREGGAAPSASWRTHDAQGRWRLE
jgi:hypothetical protein